MKSAHAIIITGINKARQVHIDQAGLNNVMKEGYTSSLRPLHPQRNLPAIDLVGLDVGVDTKAGVRVATLSELSLLGRWPLLCPPPLRDGQGRR